MAPAASGPGARLALASATGAMLLISFVTTATNLAVPALEAQFTGRPLATVSWVVSAFNVAQVTLMLVGGRLADRRGRRGVFLTGLVVFAVGALASSLSPTLELLIAARVVQAVGAALVLPTSLVAVLPSYPPERHASVVSLWSSMGTVGATVAPTISAGLLSVGGWRVVFAVAAPLALLAAAVGRSTLPDSRPDVSSGGTTPGPLDVTGAVAGTLFVGGLAFALVQGRVWGYTAPPVVGAAVSAALAAAVFLVRSLRHPEPLVDLRLLREPTFAVPAAASAVLAAAGAATWFLYPLFMSQEWGYSILQVGLGMSPGALVMVGVTLLAGRMADRYGYRRQLVLGSWLPVAGVAWMAVFLRPDTTYVTGFLPGTLLIGVGMGLVVGPMNSAALSVIPSASLGAANAAFNTLRFFGTALGVALAAAVLGDTAGADRTAAFRLALRLVTVVIAGAPVVLALAYPRRSRPRTPAHVPASAAG
ncbi:MAG: MFS transporter [Acidimicrobiales bacterium]